MSEEAWVRNDTRDNSRITRSGAGGGLAIGLWVRQGLSGDRVREN